MGSQQILGYESKGLSTGLGGLLNQDRGIPHFLIGTLS